MSHVIGRGRYARETYPESSASAVPQSFVPWTDVPAGTIVTFSAAQPALSFDSTPAATQSALNLPVAASIVDGQEVTVRLTGTTVSPILINAGAGTAVEQVNSERGAATFGTSTYLPNQGQIVTLKYDKATALWKAKSVSYGSPTAAQEQTTWVIARPGQLPAGLDSNPGTALAPIATAGEIRRRWNGGLAGVRPRLPSVAYSITIKGSVAVGHEFEDPIDVLWDLDVAHGLSMDIEGTATVQRSGGPIAVTNPFSRTATGEQVVTDAGVVDWTPDVDHLIADSTTGAVAWVTRAQAGPVRATLSSAYAAATAATITSILNARSLTPALIAAGNAYDILALPTCYFGATSLLRMSPGATDVGGTGQANVIVRRLHGLSQSVEGLLSVDGDAFVLTTAQHGATVSFVDCQIDQSRSSNRGGVTFMNCFTGVSFPAADNLGSPDDSGMILSGYSRRSLGMGAGWLTTNDHFLIGSAAFFPVSTNVTGTIVIGNAARFLHGAGGLFMMNWAAAAMTLIVTGVLYGETGGQRISGITGGSRIFSSHTAAATFITDGGAAAFFTVGGIANGVYFDLPTSTWLPVGGMAVTIANLDAARPGGLGSVAVEPNTGSRITVNGIF